MNGRYGYQIEDTRILKERKRCINGNPVGCGKSIETLDAVMELGLKRVLVITLNSLKNNFEAEILKWYPEATVTNVRNRSTVAQRDEWIRIPSQFTIVSYNQITTITEWEKKPRPDGTIYKVPKKILDKNVPTLLAQPWDGVILDEAHYLRGRGSKAKDTAYRLAKKVPYFYLLTGTIIYSSGLNAFPLLQMLDPVKFSSFHRWASEHFNKKKNYFSGFDDYTTVKNLELFKAHLAPYVVSHKAEDVHKDLPEKTFMHIPFELEPGQRKQYDTMRRKMALDFQGKQILAPSELVKILRLRQICMSPSLLLKEFDEEFNEETGALKGPKIDLVLDLVETFRNDKFLIFCCHATPVWRLLPLLQKRVKVKAITGKVPTGTAADTCNMPTRSGIIKSFKEGDTQGLIMTLGAGGVGLNLPEANRLIFLDSSTIPAENEQAIGRIMRKGQKNACFIYVPYAVNTIEEKILNICADRDAMFKASTPTSAVTEEMLKYIVRGE